MTACGRLSWRQTQRRRPLIANYNATCKTKSALTTSQSLMCQLCPLRYHSPSNICTRSYRYVGCDTPGVGPWDTRVDGDDPTPDPVVVSMTGPMPCPACVCMSVVRTAMWCCPAKPKSHEGVAVPPLSRGRCPRHTATATTTTATIKLDSSSNGALCYHVVTEVAA